MSAVLAASTVLIHITSTHTHKNMVSDYLIGRKKSERGHKKMADKIYKPEKVS